MAGTSREELRTALINDLSEWYDPHYLDPQDGSGPKLPYLMVLGLQKAARHRTPMVSLCNLTPDGYAQTEELRGAVITADTKTDGDQKRRAVAFKEAYERRVGDQIAAGRLVMDHVITDAALATIPTGLRPGAYARMRELGMRFLPEVQVGRRLDGYASTNVLWTPAGAYKETASIALTPDGSALQPINDGVDAWWGLGAPEHHAIGELTEWALATAVPFPEWQS